MWQYRGQKRPGFAIAPGPGQESVWDYPRPPVLTPDGRTIEVWFGEILIASSRQTFRVMETAHPPSFYIPPDDVIRKALIGASGRSICEWKGSARYWSLTYAPELSIVGWSYPEPAPAFNKIRGYFTFYPAALACYIDGERVRPQPGKFYGGWITNDVVGPFKGDPGSESW